MSSDFWSERKDWLKQRWDIDGASASQIARELGVTRNAVLGAIHRLQKKGEMGTRGGIVSAAPRKPVAPPPPPKPKPPPKARARPETEPPLDEAIATLPETANLQTCHWPYGDPGSEAFRYCGRPGFPWCEGHAAMAYQPAVVRRRRGRE